MIRSVICAIESASSTSSNQRARVPGCATGEEVYSIAICLLEELEGSDARGAPVQVFGTDIGETAIEKARAATYPQDIASDVSEERLRRIFTQLDYLI